MSGASGKVPAALHLTPEALDGGALAYLRDGDLVRFDSVKGVLDVRLDAAELRTRPRATASNLAHGYGRELFANMRAVVGSAEQGACTLFAA